MAENKKRKSKKRKSSIPVILIFLLGVSVLLYPTVSNIWNQYRNSKLAVEYDKKVEHLSDERKKEILEEAAEYNRKHRQNTIVDTVREKEESEVSDYASLLNPCDNGIMGTVTIPKIKQRLCCYHGLLDYSLEKGCGHMEGTSLPVGKQGENGAHTAFAAHRGLPSAKLFTDLDQLEKGDVFFFTILDENFAYEVDQVKTVMPGDFKYLQLVENEDYATLVTCTPYAVNTHRLLVRGHRIPYTEDKVKEAQEEVKKDITRKILLIGLLILFIVLSIMAVSYKKGNKENITKSDQR